MNRRKKIEEIFRAGVARVDPERMIRDALKLDDSTLTIETELQSHRLDLKSFSRVLVVGAGKASARMARGLEAVLGNRIDDGLVAVKPGHTDSLQYVELIEAGHPVPNDGSVAAGKRIAGLLDEADESTLVVVLVSGGGSALLTLPYDQRPLALTLADIQKTTKALLDSGADIREINTIRKHLSAIKGGRAAARAYPATTVSLILSDVVGDDLASIASGITYPDTGTFSDAKAIIERYDIASEIPRSVIQLLSAGARGEIADTPTADNVAFSRVTNVLIGTNAQALMAARARAIELGYNSIILTSRLEGEARDVAHLFSAIARDLVRFEGDPAVSAVPLPACLIAGGETTVSIRGDGKGGRNQEMALSFLIDLFYSSDQELKRIAFFSGGTDGNDGPTDAAGGWADEAAVTAVEATGVDPAAALAKNDSYTLLEAIDALVKTGPTNTNVCDIQILVVE